MTDDMYFFLDDKLTDPADRKALRDYHCAAKAAEQAIARRDRAIIRAAELVEIAKKAHKVWAGVRGRRAQ